MSSIKADKRTVTILWEEEGLVVKSFSYKRKLSHPSTVGQCKIRIIMMLNKKLSLGGVTWIEIIFKIDFNEK